MPMKWIDLSSLLQITQYNAADYRLPLAKQALGFAGYLQQQPNITQVAAHLDDAFALAVVLLGAWNQGIKVILPSNVQSHTISQLSTDELMWVTCKQQLEKISINPVKANKINTDRPLLELSTSGSTGQPKRIEKSIAQLVNELKILEETWGRDLQPDTLVMGSVQPQHIYGLLFRLLWPLCAGRPLLNAALPFPEELQQHTLNSTANSVIWISSPALLKRLGSNLDWAALSKKVKCIFSSGGPLPEKARQALIDESNITPIEVYGSSETGGIAWRQGGALWTPFAGVTLAVSAQGALQVSSPWITENYQQTADAITLQADGQFSLGQRLDRIVKLEEKRIALPFVEQCLEQNPLIAEARVGVINQGRMSLGALIVLTAQGLHALRNQGRAAVVQQLRQGLHAYLEPIALPRRWCLVSELPVNAQGKISQVVINQLLAEQRAKLPEMIEITTDGDQAQLQLIIPPDLVYFSGHFPKAPVVPGVVQIDWAQQLAAMHLGLRGVFQGMEVIKFQQLLRPGDRVCLDLRFDQAKRKLYFRFFAETSVYASGRILLSDE
nr:acyl-CoA synthetase family protein [Thiopseudomonas alkaliphila]